jgi:hypothetical protein
MEKTGMSMLLMPGVIALVLLAGYWALAQESAAQPAKQLQAPDKPLIYDDSQSSDHDVELLRKDVRSQKKQIVAANMDLTDAEAEKFWPIYDRYAADLAKIYDTKIALVEEYLDNYKTMNGDEAESYIRRRAATDNDIMQLRLKYVPEFRKVLSGRQTALFFQIEWRLDLLLNLQLAQAPLIDP